MPRGYETRKRQREASKAAGYCPVCSVNRSAPGRALCPICAKRSTAVAARALKKKQALGLCMCGAQPRAGRKTCQPCAKRCGLNLARSTYKLTAPQFERLKTAKICELCGRPPKPGKALCVDHDHKTGAFRGILCKSCNTMLGLGQDSPHVLRGAALYVEQGGYP